MYLSSLFTYTLDTKIRKPGRWVFYLRVSVLQNIFLAFPHIKQNGFRGFESLNFVELKAFRVKFSFGAFVQIYLQQKVRS